MHLKSINHDPVACRQALMTAKLVTVDTETTGVARHSRIVSVGVKIGGAVYILFRRSLVIRNISRAAFRWALEPLGRPDLVVLMHNAPFDIEKLRLDGITVGGTVLDSLRLLRLLDTDRFGRVDERRPPVALNYKLKDICRVRYGIDPPEEFRGGAAYAELFPYDRHVRYLISDLLLTERLVLDLWRALPTRHRQYYLTMVAPLIPVLQNMRTVGFLADVGFVKEEAAKLDDLMAHISDEHRQRFKRPLGMNEQQLRDWLFRQLRLPMPPWRPGQRTGKAPLNADALKWLIAHADDDRQRGSLLLLADYRRVASLLRNLRTPLKHVAHGTRRWHPNYDDRQVSGRISSTVANLQQISKRAKVHGIIVAPRNMMVAPPGHVLVAVDVAQADVRILAHEAEAFPRSSDEHLRQLDLDPRYFPARRLLGSWRLYLENRVNPYFRRAAHAPEPRFYLSMTKVLADAFRHGEDFYATVATTILKRPPKNKAERNCAKTLILATINGQGAGAVAEELRCTVAEARQYQKAFYAAFLDIAAYKALMYRQFAMTGMAESFMGRPRMLTPHRWMVTEPVVEIFVTYKGKDRLWLRVAPLRASLRVLTCIVIEAVDANRHSPNYGRRIYHHRRGRLSTLPYRFFNPPTVLQYCLPVRNIPWRSIRRVRTAHESARYEGFDKTARQLFNHIAQAGTADLVKAMMLRVQAVCAQFGARMILQIHDELVFEVPEMLRERWRLFLSALRKTLRTPPTADFRVPVNIEVKIGRRFGEL